jgi:hypothetical protein
MQSPNQQPEGQATPAKPRQETFGHSTRKPQRITITISQSVHLMLLEESDRQGRSLSNLASFWLEQQAEATRMRWGQTTS